MKKIYTIYILQCSDKSYYTGHTSNLDQRLFQHHEGTFRDCYTYKRRPLQLVYSTEFDDAFQAIAWERKLKKWSRKKKEALVKRDYIQIHHLSKRNTSYSYYSKIKLHIRKKIKKLLPTVAWFETVVA